MIPPVFSTRTSGDLVADRRFAYAEAALADHDAGAARDLYEQTIERVPHWPPAHLALAKACLALGDIACAIAALKAALALDAVDRLGARVLLAQIEGHAAQDAMPDAYVAGLFDEYAPRFDRHLTGTLKYRAPELILALLDEHAGGKRDFRQGLDLGCGTGLMARALQRRCTALTGVDLSAGMLEIAARSALYDRLARAGLLDFLANEPASGQDLVLAADVFCYVPDLRPVFVEVARVLVSGGLFAFSIQTRDGEGVTIGGDSRVHHTLAYVRACAALAGLMISREEIASTREDRGEPVPGALFLLAKP
jgi:predicted TPR repeat methyltransferase